MSRSKVHYKQQWSKALHELALTRQREQKSMRDKLAQQEREVNELKRSMQVASDTKVIGCVEEWVYMGCCILVFLMLLLLLFTRT